MESNSETLVFLTYARRRRPNPEQQEPTSLDNMDLGLPASSSGDEKEDSIQELTSETLYNPDRHATRKRKRKADSSDFEDYMPQSRVHGQRRGLLHVSSSQRCGARKRKAKDDSSDSENYAPRPRVRGQRKNALNCSNSITQQGMLNTKTFQLYFQNIWSRISDEKRKSFSYFDSLWFSLYTNSSYREKVLKWIKKKDIFSKKFVLVPIVMWSHWSLLILCHFGVESKSSSPCMILLDSMQSANQNLEPEIRKFIFDIHKAEERSANKGSIQKTPLLVPKVPQQRNGAECGCYVLFYANLFLENAPESFSISDGYPYFMKEDWFTIKSLDDFRRQLGSIPAKSSCSDE